MNEEQIDHLSRNTHYGKFASGDPRVDSRKWTGLASLMSSCRWFAPCAKAPATALPTTG